MNKYVENSYIMNGEDHGKGKSTTVESEAYMLSDGTNQPMQYRMH